MEFLLDTRNQKDDFVEKSLKNLGHSTERATLYFGDIAIKGQLHNCIDFKSSSGGILELLKNICSKDHNRLKREIEKSIKYGGKITFLCFEEGINSIDDIINYKIPKFKTTLWKSCYYEKTTNKKTTKLQINADFNRAIKNGSIILNKKYDTALQEFTKENYYIKKEIAHIKGEPFTKIKLETFIKALKTMTKQDHYSKGIKINFEFTTKKDCGKKIIEIFNKY